MKTNIYKAKILLAAPITDYKKYIYAQWFAHIKTLTFPNLDFYFVDNSKTIDFYNEVAKMGFEVDRIEQRGRRAVEFMAECSEQIRKYFLAGSWSHLFLLELDQFPALNCIEKLLLHDTPVISGAYQIGTGYDRLFFAMQKEQRGNIEIKRQITPYEFFNKAGQTIRSCANGTGCTLIKREVLEQIKFRTDGKTHADTFFHNDIEKLGFVSYVDTSIISAHYNQSWKTIVEHSKTPQNGKNTEF